MIHMLCIVTKLFCLHKLKIRAIDRASNNDGSNKHQCHTTSQSYNDRYLFLLQVTKCGFELRYNPNASFVPRLNGSSLAYLWIIKPLYKLDACTFSTATLTTQGDCFSYFGLKRDILQHLRRKRKHIMQPAYPPNIINHDLFQI